jgi:hypothetical protein
MTLESLEILNDEQLTAVIARAGELLKQHDGERKAKALADARAVLASAGLILKDVMARGRSRKTSKPSGRSKRSRLPTSD